MMVDSLFAGISLEVVPNCPETGPGRPITLDVAKGP
jgi:hypothetical protein